MCIRVKRNTSAESAGRVLLTGGHWDITLERYTAVLRRRQQRLPVSSARKRFLAPKSATNIAEKSTKRDAITCVIYATLHSIRWAASTFIDVTLMASNALKENESRKSSATFATNRAKLEKHFKFTCATTRESGRTSAKCVKRASYRLKCGMDTCVYIWPSSFAIATRANSAMRALHTSAALIAI